MNEHRNVWNEKINSTVYYFKYSTTTMQVVQSKNNLLQKQIMPLVIYIFTILHFLTSVLLRILKNFYTCDMFILHFPEKPQNKTKNYYPGNCLLI